MTEKLATLLHEAADRDFAAPDVGAIVRTGDKKVRRRRVTTGLAGVAALAVVGAGIGLITGGDDGVDAAAPSFTDSVTWATGSTLHSPDGSVDLGHRIRSYVRTTAGFAFADNDGVVRSYVDGEVTEIGRTSEKYPRLVGDTDGTGVGWVDYSGKRPAFVVRDLTTGEVVRSDDHTEPGMDEVEGRNPANFYALDGRTAYWRDLRGAVAVDLDTGDARVIDPKDRDAWSVAGAEDGLVARPQFAAGDDDDVAGLRIEDGAGEDVAFLEDAFGDIAYLSPDVRWVSIEGDQPEVYDVRTSERVPIDLAGRSYFGVGYEWIDEDTMVVLAARTETSPAEILTCRLPTGACGQVTELEPFDELVGDFVLPGGHPGP